MSYRKNISGQFVYFTLVSSISGNAVIGSSGGISGRRCIDGGSQIVCSGNIIEDAGGQYHLNAYDFDMNGNNIGFLFTASGCVPVNYMVLTTAANPYITPGASGGTPILDGNSGVTVSLLLSGILSGQQLTLLSGSLSGQLVSLFSGNLSGQLVGILSGQLSGQQINLQSGNTVSLYSGSLSGQFVNLFSGSLSGQLVGILSGQLSGQLVNLLSGNSVAVWSGTRVNTYSGQVFLASGQISVEIPNKTLGYDWNNVSGEASRSLINAERKLRNKWDTTSSSGKLTVYKEDGTTPAYTQDLTATSGAEPITSLGN